MTKTCPPGKELNANGNCVKKCIPPSVRNPETQRCKKPTTKKTTKRTIKRTTKTTTRSPSSPALPPNEQSVAMKLIELENLKIAYNNLKIKCDEDNRQHNTRTNDLQNTIRANILNLDQLSDQNRVLNDSLQRLTSALQQCTSDKDECNVLLEDLRRQSNDLNDNINDTQEENNNVSGIQGLLPVVEQEDSSVLDGDVFDIIMQSDVNIREFLKEDLQNIILIEDDKIHAATANGINISFYDASVFACKRVGLSNDIDHEKEIFNGSRLGTYYGYILAEDIKSAILMNLHGFQVFKTTNVLSTVPAIASRGILEGGGGSHRCQPGASGELKGLIAIKIRGLETPLYKIPTETMMDNNFIKDAFKIAENATITGGGYVEIKNEIKRLGLDLNIDISRKKDIFEFDLKFDYGNTIKFNPEIIKLLNMMRPKFKSLVIRSGSLAGIELYDINKIIKPIIGLEIFSMTQTNRSLGISMYDVVKSLLTHVDTLHSISLDTIQGFFLPLSNFKNLKTISLRFEDYDHRKNTLSSFVRPLKELKLLENVTLSDSERTDIYSGEELKLAIESLPSSVKKLELNLFKFYGSIEFLDNLNIENLIVNVPNQNQSLPTREEIEIESRERERRQVEAERQNRREQFEAERQNRREQFEAERQNIETERRNRREQFRQNIETERQNRREQFEAERQADREQFEAERQNIEAVIQNNEAVIQNREAPIQNREAPLQNSMLQFEDELSARRRANRQIQEINSVRERYSNLRAARRASGLSGMDLMDDENREINLILSRFRGN